LPVHHEARLGVVGSEVLACDAQHAAGAGGGVVDRADHARLRKGVVVLDEEQVHHQPDDFAWGEVLAGGLVGKLGEFPDQLLEDGAHGGVVDGFGVQVDGGEFLGHQVEQAGLGQAVNLGVKLEALEDVARGRRERLQVRAQVFADVVLVAHQLFQVERRRVVEELPGFSQQERLGVDAGTFALGQLGQHR
jgi:hypothetical protein